MPVYNAEMQTKHSEEPSFLTNQKNQQIYCFFQDLLSFVESSTNRDAFQGQRTQHSHFIYKYHLICLLSLTRELKKYFILFVYKFQWALHSCTSHPPIKSSSGVGLSTKMNYKSRNRNLFRILSLKLSMPPNQNYRAIFFFSPKNEDRVFIVTLLNC